LIEGTSTLQQHANGADLDSEKQITATTTEEVANLSHDVVLMISNLELMKSTHPLII